LPIVAVPLGKDTETIPVLCKVGAWTSVTLMPSLGFVVTAVPLPDPPDAEISLIAKIGTTGAITDGSEPAAGTKPPVLPLGALPLDPLKLVL